MNKDPIDPETLAAFLEGRLDTREHGEVLERIARDPDAYELFVDAAAIERELGAATAGGGSRREKFRSVRGRSPWRFALPLAAAAGIVALFLGRALHRSVRTPLLLADASTLLAPSGASTLESALGATWAEPAWTGTRGSVSALSPAQRAFRLGSRLAVFGLAVDAADTVAARHATVESRALLEDVQGGPPIAARLDNISAQVRSGGRSGDAAQALNEVASDLRALVPDVWLRTGAWLAQARLAARAGAAPWFTPDGAAITELRQLVTILRSDSAPSAQTAAGRLETVLSTAMRGLERAALIELILPLDTIASEAAGR
jgi:hypothetical protein